MNRAGLLLLGHVSDMRLVWAGLLYSTCIEE